MYARHVNTLHVPISRTMEKSIARLEIFHGMTWIPCEMVDTIVRRTKVRTVNIAGTAIQPYVTAVSVFGMRL